MKLYENCPYDIETLVSNMRTVERCISIKEAMIQSKELELKDLRKDLDLLYTEHEDLCSWIEKED